MFFNQKILNTKHLGKSKHTTEDIAADGARARGRRGAILTALMAVVCLGFPAGALAKTPFLAFSDLVSGPDEGLNDSKGSGVVVTLWGQNLGSAQNDSKVLITDSSGKTREAANVYYWRNADGRLPSGPANLYASHKMQEIAFSIPAGADGPAVIKVAVNGQESNRLNFLVRPGNIYHVKANGSDTGGDGSFDKPWQTIEKADSVAPAGSTIYVHGVVTGDKKSARGIYWNNAEASSSLTAQFALVAYPGTRPKVTAQRGISAYQADGLVVSKFDIYASNYTSVDANGQPTGDPIAYGDTWGIKTTKDGRFIANRIGDIPGGCASKWNGAILGNARGDLDRVSNAKMFGNEIYEYGCNGTDKLHHTTYMAVRSESGIVVAPWEWGYNYLWGNKAKNGIHQYDQDATCGDVSGPIRIHDNVIVNQAGAGISIGAGNDCTWTMDSYIYNNVLINVGLAAAWDGVSVDTSSGPVNGGINIRDAGVRGLTGAMHVYNNLIYKPASDGQTVGGRGCLLLSGDGDSVEIIWTNNICLTEPDQPLVGVSYQADAKLDNIQGSNNAWFIDGSAITSAELPPWSVASITKDPKIAISGGQVSYGTDSPLIDSATSVDLGRDVYGTPRLRGSIDVGPYEKPSEVSLSAPEPPNGLSIQ